MIHPLLGVCIRPANNPPNPHTRLPPNHPHPLHPHPTPSNPSTPFIHTPPLYIHSHKPVSPYQDLEKATVLQECRVFHDANVVTQDPRRCCQLITKLLHILTQVGFWFE